MSLAFEVVKANNSKFIRQGTPMGSNPSNFL